MTDRKEDMAEERDSRESSIRSRIRTMEARDKKMYAWLAVCLIIGIVLMNLGNGSFRAPASVTEGAALPAASTAVADDLEEKLTVLLSAVKGAGRVKVAVAYSEGVETVYVYDRDASEEAAADGMNTASSERTTISAVNNTPVQVKQLQPKVLGVSVVAEGAHDPLVRERLYQAVRGLTGINANQIAIIEGEGSGDDAVF